MKQDDLQETVSNKPWAKLRMTRREYEIKKPWRFGSSGKKMRRALFEKCLLALDQEDIDAAIEEAMERKQWPRYAIWPFRSYAWLEPRRFLLPYVSALGSAARCCDSWG